eukprot:6282478-Pyramimonas_sp.AAC.1
MAATRSPWPTRRGRTCRPRPVRPAQRNLPHPSAYRSHPLRRVRAPSRGASGGALVGRLPLNMRRAARSRKMIDAKAYAIGSQRRASGRSVCKHCGTCPDACMRRRAGRVPSSSRLNEPS